MSAHHYRQVEAALHYLEANRGRQPTLADVAAHIGLSEFHFQRLFSEWAGVSPKRFLQFLNREYLKTRLDQSASILDATFDAGLSSVSRTHELFVTTEGITPAQYRSLGRDLHIRYGLHDSPFGPCLIAVNNDTLCHLAFVNESETATVEAFRQDWQAASLKHDQVLTAAMHEKIFGSDDRHTALLLRGTPFQLKVWEALLSIPAGEILAYENVAALAGNLTATRATASAIARNRIALLIPCHRVIRKIGESGEYRWGKPRKRLLLAWEAARRETAGD